MGPKDGGLTPFEFALAGVEPPEEVASPSLDVLAAMRALATSVDDAPVTDPGLARLLADGAPRRDRPPTVPVVRPATATAIGRSSGVGRAAPPGAFVDITPNELHSDSPLNGNESVEAGEVTPGAANRPEEAVSPLPPTDGPIELVFSPDASTPIEPDLPPIDHVTSEVEPGALDQGTIEDEPLVVEPEPTQPLDLTALAPSDPDDQPVQAGPEAHQLDGSTVPDPPAGPERPIPAEPNESLLAQVRAAQAADEAIGHPADLTGPDTTGPDTTGPDTASPATTGPDATGPTPSDEAIPQVADRSAPSGGPEYTDPRFGPLVAAGPESASAPESSDPTWDEIEQVRADLHALSAANGTVGAEAHPGSGVGHPVTEPPGPPTSDDDDQGSPVPTRPTLLGAAAVAGASGPGAGTGPADARLAIPMTQVGASPEPVQPGLRSRRLLASSGALLAVACLAVLGWWWWGESRDSDTDDALSTRTVTESSDTTVPTSSDSTGGGEGGSAGEAGSDGREPGEGSSGPTSEFGSRADEGDDGLSVSTSSTTGDAGNTTTVPAPTTATSTTSTTDGTTETSQTTVTTSTTTTTTTTTSATEPTPTTTPPLAYIGDRVSVDDYEGPGLGGVEVSLWEDTDRDGTGDRLVASTTTGGDGRYFFDQPAGCYEVRFRPPSGYQIRGGFERQALCVDPGEAAARIDAIADAEIRAAGPSGCLVERAGSSFTLGIEVYESSADWADSYTFYDLGGGVVARTRDLGSPDDIDNSGDHEWWGQSNGFDHRSVWSVSAERNGVESDPVSCQR